MNPAPLRGLRAAFAFLTRLPVGGYPYRDEDYAWAPAHAPVVGLVVGGVGALAFALFLGAGAVPAALLALALTALVTGGFHEDGLADTADALGGAIFDAERVLQILKDSRIGTYGALALVFGVGLRVSLVAELAGRDPSRGALLGGSALVLSHVMARVAPTWLMASLPYVTDSEHARSRPVVQAQRPAAVVATLWGALALLAARLWLPLPSAALWSLVPALALATALCAWRFVRRVGGITGDFLGATEQVGEITVLLCLALSGPAT